MFHRRLLFLGIGFIAVLVVLSSQLVRLSVVEGAERLDEAMRRLDRAEFLPTIRGSILDRRGRVLAEDRAHRDLAANFEFISGVWAVREAGDAARRRAISQGGRAAWAALDGEARQAAILAELPEADAEADRIWDSIVAATGVDRRELESRLDAIRAEVHRKALAVSDRRVAIEAERLAAGDVDRPPPPQGPIREQKAFHVVVEDLDPLAAIELERLAEAHPEAIEVRHTIGREHPWAAAAVAVDRRSLPSPIRRGDSIEVEVADPIGLLLGSVGEEVWAEDLARHRFVPPMDRSISAAMRGSRNGSAEAAWRRPSRIACAADAASCGATFRAGRSSGSTRRAARISNSRSTRRCRLVSRRSSIPRSASPCRSSGMPAGPAASRIRSRCRGSGDRSAVRWSCSTCAPARSSPRSRHRANHKPTRCRRGGATSRARLSCGPSRGCIRRDRSSSRSSTRAPSRRAHPADGAIECTGHFFPNLDNVARCWIYRDRFGLTTHTAQFGGPLPVEEAIARSCNIYFYELARRLGPARTIEWLRRFGLDRRFGIGLGWKTDASGDSRPRGEHAGFLPDPEELAATVRGGDRVTPVLLGIGQGPVAWTPLQAANAYAILARGGDVLEPTLLRTRGEREPSERLEIPRDAVLRALEGLRRAVADPVGTGHHLTLADGTREPLLEIPGIRVWGKTGTARRRRCGSIAMATDASTNRSAISSMRGS